MCSTNGKEVRAPVTPGLEKKLEMMSARKSKRGLNYIKSYRDERTLACAKREMETHTGF